MLRNCFWHSYYQQNERAAPEAETTVDVGYVARTKWTQLLYFFRSNFLASKFIL
jgi:hypothetical protein